MFLRSTKDSKTQLMIGIEQLGDICKIVTNGATINDMNAIKNRSNYIQGKTVLYNRYGGVYTFYAFPCSSCDPFGYTNTAYNKVNKN